MNVDQLDQCNDMDQMLAARIRDSVAGMTLPPDFSARLGHAIASRRRAVRRRMVALVAMPTLLVLLAGTFSAVRARKSSGRSAPASIVATVSKPEDGRQTFVAGWTLAGLCRGFRRRRRDVQISDGDRKNEGNQE